MNHGLLSRRALVAGGLVVALASTAKAGDLIDGLITWGNSANLRYDCTVADPGYLSYSFNDLQPAVTGLPGFNGAFPNIDWQPDASSIAHGNNDFVAQIAYGNTDPCNSCGAGWNFDNVCYRGAIDPAGANWTAGWTFSGDLVDIKQADWPTRGIRVLAGVQPTQTFASDSLYLLQGKVEFPAGTTLTIQAGSLVVGESASTGYLVINRDADINAQGTAANPIIMTTDLDPPVPGSWGGLVIHGKAVSNCADCLGGASCISEGGAGSHCGTNDCDNSGTLRYIVLGYSGFEIAPDNELNCFTFNSVGSGTTVDFLQAHQGTDDAFEWFGGHVTCKRLLATAVGDDGLDWQMGFRGAVQYAIVQMYPGIGQGDSGIEADNNEFNHNAPCRSAPIIANCTLVGAAGIPGWGARLRRGTDFMIFNTIITNWVNQALRIENDATCAGLNPATGSFCGPTDAPVVAAASAVDGIRAFPNPVVAGTNFEFSLSNRAAARLDIFDVTGRRVANVLNDEMEAGRHTVAWTPEAALPAGTYFYRLETGASPAMGRIVVVR